MKSLLDLEKGKVGRERMDRYHVNHKQRYRDMDDHGFWNRAKVSAGI